jgi:hypothetical protein
MKIYIHMEELRSLSSQLNRSLQELWELTPIASLAI